MLFILAQIAEDSNEEDPQSTKIHSPLGVSCIYRLVDMC